MSALALAGVSRDDVSVATFFSTTEENILSYRLGRQQLYPRLKVGDVASVIANLGLPSPSQRELMIATAARIKEVVGPEMEQALYEERTLAQSYSFKLALRLYWHSDIHLFTRALLPITENELRYYLQGSSQLLRTLDFRAEALIELLQQALVIVLEEKPLVEQELLVRLGEVVESRLDAAGRERWHWPDVTQEGRTIGEVLLEQLFPLLSWTGNLSKVDFQQKGSLWTYRYLPFDSEVLRASEKELVHRFLRLHGPATLADFEAYLGAGVEQARRLWESAAEELVLVESGNTSGYLAEQDLPLLQEENFAEGVRLVSHSDPWLSLPEQCALGYGKQVYNYFFRASEPGPGMVLFDGQCVAGWRWRESGSKLYVTIEDIGLSLGRISISELEAEVEHLAQTLQIELGGLTWPR